MKKELLSVGLSDLSAAMERGELSSEKAERKAEASNTTQSYTHPSGIAPCTVSLFIKMQLPEDMV